MCASIIYVGAGTGLYVHTQNHKIADSQRVEVAWDLPRSSGPPSCSSRVTKSQLSRTKFTIWSIGEIQLPPWATWCQCSVTLRVKKCSIVTSFWCSEGTSSVSVCDHCLRFCNGTPLNIAWVLHNTVTHSCKLLCSWVALSIYRCMELFLPRCRTCQFPLLNSMGFCEPISPVFQSSSTWQHKWQPVLLILCHLQRCWGSILSHHLGH